MLVSGIQHNDSYINMLVYIYIYILFSDFFLIGYYKILSIVPWAIQWVLVGYLFYI